MNALSAAIWLTYSSKCGAEITHVGKSCICTKPGELPHFSVHQKCSLLISFLLRDCKCWLWGPGWPHSERQDKITNMLADQWAPWLVKVSLQSLPLPSYHNQLCFSGCPLFLIRTPAIVLGGPTLSPGWSPLKILSLINIYNDSISKGKLKEITFFSGP